MATTRTNKTLRSQFVEREKESQRIFGTSVKSLSDRYNGTGVDCKGARFLDLPVVRDPSGKELLQREHVELFEADEKRRDEIRRMEDVARRVIWEELIPTRYTSDYSNSNCPIPRPVMTRRPVGGNRVQIERPVSWVGWNGARRNHLVYIVGAYLSGLAGLGVALYQVFS